MREMVMILAVRATKLRCLDNRMLGPLLLAWLVAVSGAMAQQSADKCTASPRDAYIPLDGTGIGDHRFLSPLSPYDLFDEAKDKLDEGKYKQCAAEAEIQFVNSRAGRGFIVSFEYERQRAPDLIGTLEELIGELERDAERDSLEHLFLALEKRREGPGEQVDAVLETAVSLLEGLLRARQEENKAIGKSGGAELDLLKKLLALAVEARDSEKERSSQASSQTMPSDDRARLSYLCENAPRDPDFYIDAALLRMNSELDFISKLLRNLVAAPTIHSVPPQASQTLTAEIMQAAKERELVRLIWVITRRHSYVEQILTRLTFDPSDDDISRAIADARSRLTHMSLSLSKVKRLLYASAENPEREEELLNRKRALLVESVPDIDPLEKLVSGWTDSLKSLETWRELDPNQIVSAWSTVRGLCGLSVKVPLRRTLVNRLVNLKSRIEEEGVQTSTLEEMRDLDARCDEVLDTCRLSVFAGFYSNNNPAFARLKEMAVRLHRDIQLVGDFFDSNMTCEDGKCTYSVSIFEGGRFVIPPGVWKNIVDGSPGGLAEFSVRFFDEEASPSNNRGFIRVREKLEDSGSQFVWQVGASLGWSRDPLPGPDSGGENARFSREMPFSGETRRRFPATGFLELEQTLGNRARATVQLNFKEGDLGDSAGRELDVEVGQYNIQIFNRQGWALRFGKQSYAAPTSGIAIDEFGEGVQVFFPSKTRSSLTHIIKRESATGSADAENSDSSVTIYQFNLGLPPWEGGVGTRAIRFRTLGVTALYGKDEGDSKRAPYDYLTFGSDISFGKSIQGWTEQIRGQIETADGCMDLANDLELCKSWIEKEYARSRDRISWKQGKWQDTKMVFSGSLGAYRSIRDTADVFFAVPAAGAERRVAPKGVSGATEMLEVLPDADGGAALLTLHWNRLRISAEAKGAAEGAKAPRNVEFETQTMGSVTLRLGRGTADDPDTPEFEGYTGETNGFAPDRLLLGTFSVAPLEGENGLNPIGAGLSNKIYLGGRAVFGRNFINPLAELAKLLLKDRQQESGGKEVVVSQATTFGLHAYGFGERVFDDRFAGVELGLEFQVEVPKDVKTTLSYGRLFLGDALEPLFDKDPSVISITTSLVLK